MIRPPQRAVTRFFVPLIDVLILLFCIFLLMPFVSRPEDAAELSTSDSSSATDIEALRNQLASAQRRIAQLQRERSDLFGRYRVQILEIDRDTGKLYAFDDEKSQRKEIASRVDALRLVDRERSRAGARELCFFILYPRDLSAFPLRSQVESYRLWFKDVPHAFDNPWN